MKAHKIEILVIDFDRVGADEISGIIENANFPNDCIRPQVKSVETVDIGEWDDDHPLNLGATSHAEYLKLFPK